MKKLLHKKLNKNGFTLAELLIVVAIIGVLVAVAMPIFFSAKADAELAVKQANCRSVLAQATADYLPDSTLSKDKYTYGGIEYTVTVDASTHIITVTCDGLKCDTENPEPTAPASK